MRDLLSSQLAELRYEPTKKRVRALLEGHVVADTRRAMLVWEPRRVVPSYAVPVAALVADLAPLGTADPEAVGAVGLRLSELTRVPVLDPSIPFDVHSADGETFDVVLDATAGAARTAAAFRPADATLADYVVLDFDAFDWLEEDDAIVSHPSDPFHRIDVRNSSRHVRLELDGHVIAESTRARMLFETLLPVRYYLPPEDVQVELVPSATRTYCAYKGRATYSSPVLPTETVADLGWSYLEPLNDALSVGGRVAFFNERVDLVVDGERQVRPITPWS